jgi:uncharacterized secreted protein with C-terminal beta-propeller domain
MAHLDTWRISFGKNTYMQKMDDNHLLTIGYDAEDFGDFGRLSGVMLQIFDVKNPTAPKLKFKHVISHTMQASSEALTNHLAFTYYAPKSLLSIPLTICQQDLFSGMYNRDTSFSGLMVFNASTDKGFSLRGKVTYSLPLGSKASCCHSWTQAGSQVKRSLFIDTFVYSFSDEQFKVNHLDKLDIDLATLPLR